MKKNICFFTGTRAEYGLLKNIMSFFNNDHDINLQILCSGMHLSSQFGKTDEEIEKDGFKISKKIDILLSSGTQIATLKSMGLASIGFADGLSELSPDTVIILGDRFEALICAQCCLILNIPIVHIHGGEITQGLIDEAIRHSITKMASLHLTSNEKHRNRVIQLGESPGSVFNIGAPGLDNIAALVEETTSNTLAEILNIEFKSQIFSITYHPVTLSQKPQRETINQLLEALTNYDDTSLVFTAPNSDPNSYEILEAIHNFCKKNNNAHFYQSLGNVNYLKLLKAADLVIGNSSSGIIEAPYLRTPTVDIGERQKGREKGLSVFSCQPTSGEINTAIARALKFDFNTNKDGDTLLYGTGGASAQAHKIIRHFLELPHKNKSFFDVDFQI